MRYDDMTPDRKAAIEALIESWLEQNVEVKHENGQKMFRLRTSRQAQTADPSALPPSDPEAERT